MAGFADLLNIPHSVECHRGKNLPEVASCLIDKSFPKDVYLHCINTKRDPKGEIPKGPFSFALIGYFGFYVSALQKVIELASQAFIQR
jgi:hypothetical protein